MATVAIVSQKGGSGKTTLALHLAAAAAQDGRVSFVMDTDPQATAAAWGDWRGDVLPGVVTSPPARLAKAIETAEKNGVEFIVIDTPPHSDSATREAVKSSDLVLIPTRPRAFDLHALEATAELIKFAGKRGYIVLNTMPARATLLAAEAKAAAKLLGLDVCPVSLGDRAAFHRSSSTGEVATEYEPDGKAAGEVQALWKWVRKQLAIPPRK